MEKEIERILSETVEAFEAIFGLIFDVLDQKGALEMKEAVRILRAVAEATPNLIERSIYLRLAHQLDGNQSPKPTLVPPPGDPSQS